jgi:hypothetical protein
MNEEDSIVNFAASVLLIAGRIINLYRQEQTLGNPLCDCLQGNE